MKIDRPGTFAVSTDEYHADPCPEPSLSSSIVRVLINRTPLHAWTASPRLNPDWEPEEKTTFDIGRVAHEILLGKGGGYQIVVADDWTRKAAKEARDEARAAGRSPILNHQFDAALAMVEKARAKLDAAGITLEPTRSEIVVAAQIEGVWCRAMIDNADVWPTAPIVDFKTCNDASVEAILRSVQAYGYDVQDRWYREVWKAATGEDRPFLFLFAEKEPPHACQIIDLLKARGHENDWDADAAEKCAEARRIWRGCLDTGEWPDYPDQVVTLLAPIWHRNRWADKQTIGPSQAALDAARRAQAPEGYDG